MKIALLALHFAEYASRLALALSARHEVLLVLRSRNAQNELPEDLRALLHQTLTVRSLDLPGLRDPRLLGIVVAINRILRKFSPDILHVQEVHPAYTGWASLSFRKRLPVILEVHDHVPHSGWYFSTSNWRFQVVQWFRRRATRLIVHGPRMQADLAALDASVAGRIDVVPHGILGRASIEGDISQFDPGTFLFFGRIEAYKGLRYLLDAGDILQRRGHHFRLVLAGTGSDLERERERIASCAWVELNDRYIPAAEVPELFRRAMAVVLPYTDASQTGVGAIAFAHARPVIATSVGDLPDLVSDGQSGLLVPPRDAKALADAMEKLLLDRPLRDSLARGAARTASEKLSWPRIADMAHAAYRRAIDSR